MNGVNWDQIEEFQQIIAENHGCSDWVEYLEKIVVPQLSAKRSLNERFYLLRYRFFWTPVYRLMIWMGWEFD